jgi:hypothetical protein
MFKKFTSVLIILLTIFSLIHIDQINAKKTTINENELTIFGSIRKSIEEVIIIPDSDPFFGIIGASIACWYDVEMKKDGLLPLIVQDNGKLAENQVRFLNKYLDSSEKKLLVLGNSLQTDFNKKEIIGNPPDVALDVSTHVFIQSSTVLIVPYKTINAYDLSLIASPLASYLNIPILIFDENQMEIQQVCNFLNTTDAYVIGDIQLQLSNVTLTFFKTEEEIQNELIDVIKNCFGEVNYLTLSNPSDIYSSQILESNISLIRDHINNIQFTISGNKIDIIGKDFKQYSIEIPYGLNRVRIHGTIIRKIRPILDKLNPIDPIIFMNLQDPDGNIVAYSNSLAYEIGETYLETLTCNLSGAYTLTVRLYKGLKGGYFTQRGFSLINNDIEININISNLEKPHMPLIPKLSIMAPYLTSAHGGMIIADSDFAITTEEYSIAADASGSGPSYNEKLHEFTNQKVNYTIQKLNDLLIKFDDNGILESYLDGPAWLAILAGTNMIPMYYYGPSQQGLREKGLASDNPYSLDWNLSVGRVVGWNIQDVSLLISQTFFYQDICGEPTQSRNWHNQFSFIFGEGFGETGGIFHQIPYALEILKYGFKPRVYGNFLNSRLLTDLFNTYTGSNYIEYLGHADWFWFTPVLYGPDYYSRAIDVAHVKNWIYEKPSIFLSSACLMGRIDGIPPEMNIGLSMLHAGCNGFIGATRETGPEAGLETFENHLIIDDYSVGEALRGEKRIDKELPTYYVRTLYGDPAFNPYEPNNGFSNQGRPMLK